MSKVDPVDWSPVTQVMVVIVFACSMGLLAIGMVEAVLGAMRWMQAHHIGARTGAICILLTVIVLCIQTGIIAEIIYRRRRKIAAVQDKFRHSKERAA